MAISPKPSRSPKVEPINSRLAPGLSAIPSLLLPGRIRESSLWKKYWWLIVLALIILLGGLWYWWPGRGTSFVADQIESTTSRPVLYRSSTLPSGTFQFQDSRARIELVGLTPSVEGQTYSLIVADLPSDWSIQDLTDDSSWNLGDFTMEADGTLNIAREPQRFDIPAEATSANTAIVALNQNDNLSVVLVGSVTAGTSDIYPLKFPADFVSVESSLVLQRLAGEDTTKPKLTFIGLPDISKYGFRYEARLAEFAGALPASETTLGQFDAVGDTTTLQEIVFSPLNITKFTDLAISLEPVWDTDPAISPIKPFSALLETND